ncbi:MAG: diacylglycerol kinase family lipid kinase [Anaerolineae bacterium]|nr:diacylglycerol kinase family lipid kinase [Anaerolineae bacterium]
MNVDPLRICVIVNPVSGVNRAALDVIEDFFAAQPGLDYRLLLTQGSGDGRRFAEQAVSDGYNLVAAYGGDGTMMEVADGLRGSGVPFALLPGGTANVMSIDLGIPQDLPGALALAIDPERRVRMVDMGCIDNQYFLLRAGIGYEAEISASAARSDKSRLGRLAYVENALRKLRHLLPSQYVITIDGETHIRHGITCMICNSSSIGIPNLRLIQNGRVDDGLLDVLVIRNLRPGTILRTLFQIIRSLLPANPSSDAPNGDNDHWQGREVTVIAKRRQLVAVDGEPLKRSKRVSAYIVPSALAVVVPPEQVPDAPPEPVHEAVARN